MVRTSASAAAARARRDSRAAAGPTPCAMSRSAGSRARIASSVLPRRFSRGRAILLDEADDPPVRAALTADAPAARRRGLRARRLAGAVRREGAAPDLPRAARGRRSPRDRRASASTGSGSARAAILLDASGLSAAQIAHEVARQIVRATIDAYGAAEDAFLTPALVEALAVDPADAQGRRGGLDAGRRADRGLPRAPGRARPPLGGRGPAAVSAAPASSARSGSGRPASGEAPLSVALAHAPRRGGARSRVARGHAAGARRGALLRRRRDRGGPVAAAAVRPRIRRARCRAARGALGAPPLLRARRTSDDALRVAWPEDAGAGAAVVRYRDAGAAGRRPLPRAGRRAADPALRRRARRLGRRRIAAGRRRPARAGGGRGGPLGRLHRTRGAGERGRSGRG